MTLSSVLTLCFGVGNLKTIWLHSLCCIKTSQQQDSWWFVKSETSQQQGSWWFVKSETFWNTSEKHLSSFMILDFSWGIWSYLSWTLSKVLWYHNWPCPIRCGQWDHKLCLPHLSTEYATIGTPCLINISFSTGSCIFNQFNSLCPILYSSSISTFSNHRNLKENHEYSLKTPTEQ